MWIQICLWFTCRAAFNLSLHIAKGNQTWKMWWYVGFLAPHIEFSVSNSHKMSVLWACRFDSCCWHSVHVLLQLWCICLSVTFHALLRCQFVNGAMFSVWYLARSLRSFIWRLRHRCRYQLLNFLDWSMFSPLVLHLVCRIMSCLHIQNQNCYTE